MQIAALAGLAAATYVLHLEVSTILVLTFGAITFSVADQVRVGSVVENQYKASLLA